MGLAADTIVRTSEGDKRWADIQVGNILFNELDEPVMCSRVFEPREAELKRVSYPTFETHMQESFFCCTSDHILRLEAAPTNPYINDKNRSHYVAWFTKCDQDITAEEFKNNQLDPIIKRLVSISDNDDLDYILVRGKEMIDNYINGGGTKKEIIRDSMCYKNFDLFLQQSDKSVNETNEQVLQRALAKRTEEVIFGLQQERAKNDSDEDATSNSSVHQSMRKRLKTRHESLKKKRDICRCKGFRQVSAPFGSAEEAQQMLDILKSNRSEIIDPFIVHKGDVFIMTVDEFEFCRESCVKHISKTIKLTRCPLTPQLSPTPVASEDLPLEGRFLGLFLGDGSVGDGGISSSDIEVYNYLSQYAERLTMRRGPNLPALSVSRQQRAEKGTVNSSGILANSDVYHYRITQGKRHTTSNPITDALRGFNMFKNKYKRIPEIYFHASLEDRLALLAGMIEIDGSYHKKQNHYKFQQSTDDHLDLVGDFKRLAESCGINTLAVKESFVKRTAILKDPDGPPRPSATAYLVGEGCKMLQPYLTIERKRMDLSKIHRDRDGRFPTVSSEIEKGQVRDIELQNGGSYIQLADRLIVHC